MHVFSTNPKITGQKKSNTLHESQAQLVFLVVLGARYQVCSQRWLWVAEVSSEVWQELKASAGLAAFALSLIFL